MSVVKNNYSTFVDLTETELWPKENSRIKQVEIDISLYLLLALVASTVPARVYTILVVVVHVKPRAIP